MTNECLYGTCQPQPEMGDCDDCLPVVYLEWEDAAAKIVCSWSE